MVAGGLWWAARGESVDEPTTPIAAAATTSAPTIKKALGWAPSQMERDAAKTLADELSLEDLAGQLIVARHRNDAASLALVRDKHFAGVMVTSPQILDVTTNDPLSKVKAFNADLQEAGADRDYPVMVPIDQEGGLVARLRQPLTPFPTFMSAGAAIAGDPEARRAGRHRRGARVGRRAAGRRLQHGVRAGRRHHDRCGRPDHRQPIRRHRPADRRQGGRRRGDGYSQAGLISSVKHFPGHNVDSDSHQRPPAARQRQGAAPRPRPRAVQGSDRGRCARAS